MIIRKTILALVLTGFGTFAAAQLPSHITLKRAADLGLAMHGNGTSAWGVADEELSLRAQRSVAAIMPEANDRGREGNLALARACGTANALTSAQVKRAENLSDYASMMDVFEHKDVQAPHVRMIAMNRMDGFAQGYEKGALEAWQLAFKLQPELKAKICSEIEGLVRKR